MGAAVLRTGSLSHISLPEQILAAFYPDRCSFYPLFFIRLHHLQTFSATASSGPGRPRFPVRCGGYSPGRHWHDDPLVLRRRRHPVEQQLHSHVCSRGHEMGRRRGRKVLPKSAASRRGTFCLQRNLFCRATHSGGGASDLVSTHCPYFDDCGTVILL